MIRVEGVTVNVRPRRPHDDARVPILDAVDLTVERGEWLALAGANGAGKTTLLRAIAGLVPLSTGTVTLGNGGTVPARVGMVLQEPDNQLITSSVRHDLELSLAHTPPELRRVCLAEAGERFALGGLWERNPHRLSGGEKQRVALASVWLESPDVVLLDEPAAFLDPPMTRRCIEFAHEMCARGAAVVWSASRDADVAHAGSVACLAAGRVVFRGTHEAFAARPEYAAIVTPPPPARGAARVTDATVDVSFENVALSFDGVKVLTGLDLAVRAGECVGVAGDNGAGKSSLLHLAMGALEPTGGRVTRRHDAAHTAYLPQSPERMFFAETVREELSFGLNRRGVRGAEADARCAHALDGVGLAPRTFLERVPFDLSPGEMRRVAFAVATVLEPSILLLDEPTAGLDAGGVELLYRVLEQCRQRGTTVIVASHDSGFLAVCDRVITLPARAS